MCRVTSLTIVCLMVLLAAAPATGMLWMSESDGTVGATAGPQQQPLAREDAPTAFESVYYDGYGSVTVLSDGVIIIRIDGDPPSDEAGWREPLESYSLAMNTEGLSLVDADGEWFLDRSGTALELQGLSPADVSVIPLDDRPQPDPGDCQRQSVLEINGDMLFEWVAESGSGYLDVCSPDGSSAFRLEFGISDPTGPGGAVPLGGRGHCYIMCPEGYCEIWCSFFGIFLQAHCYCAQDGTPVCECVGGPGGDGFHIEVGSAPAQTPGAQQQSQSAPGG